METLRWEVVYIVVCLLDISTKNIWLLFQLMRLSGGGGLGSSLFKGEVLLLTFVELAGKHEGKSIYF